MLDIRQLTDDDIDEAMALSTQTGWNQLPADWKRFLSLCPDGCFAGTVDGDVVATTTVITYGDEVSWVGMVLVDESHRSQGYGTRIFERGLEYAESHGGEHVGLDATRLGEPIYRQYSFRPVAPVVRWQGALDFATDEDEKVESDTVEPVNTDAVDALCSFDRERVNVDRTEFLRELLSEPNAVAVWSRGPSGIDGYAIGRPGRRHWQIGPVVTAEPNRIEPLFRALSRRAGLVDVIVDAPERPKLDAQLERLELTPARELTRMTYPEAEPALLTDSVSAFTDFAFG